MSDASARRACLSYGGAVLTRTSSSEGVSMAPVVIENREALVERRDAILRALGMTLDEFHALEVSRTLTGEEWDAREELDEIAFLLGDDETL